MKIMVTGSAGFIGKHLVKKLESEGYTVFGIDRKTGMDITEPLFPSMFKGHDVDFIFHLAGDCSTSRSLKTPEISFVDNFGTTVIMSKFAQVKKCPIIFTSTCKVEKGHDGARTPYGTSKFCAEEWLKEYHASFGVQYIINRPGTIYGPGQDASAESGWLSWFIKASIRRLPIKIFGKGNQSRDVLYISDYIDLLVDQLNNFNKYKNKTYDVGGGEDNEISINDTVEMLKLDAKHTSPRKGDVIRFVSSNKVSDINGWKPKVDYLSGIKTTKEYYEKE